MEVDILYGVSGKVDTTRVLADSPEEDREEEIEACVQEVSGREWEHMLSEED